MQLRRVMAMAGVLGCAVLSRAQQPAGAAPAPDQTVIRTETRVVLVDTVVTDKKGNYVRDLTAKDFRVWEDNKEQPISSFSFEADAASPLHGQKHYLVLLFDNSSVQMADQIPARQAAMKFIEANAGEDRMIAVMDFGGSLHIAQNFTNDTEKLKRVVSNPKFSNVGIGGGNEPVEVASLSMPQLGRAESDFAVNSLLLALRTLARNLGSVPGRKSLVVLTAGFPLTPEYQSELPAVIDACNKANVAIYPIDVRGLIGGGVVNTLSPRGALTYPFDSAPRLAPAAFISAGEAGAQPWLQLAAFLPPGPVAFFQHGGGAGGGGGVGGGGGGGHAGGGGGGVGGGGSSGGGSGGGGGSHGGGGGGTGSGSGGGRGSGGSGSGGGRGGGNSGGGAGGGRGGGGGGMTMMPGMYNPAMQNLYNQSRQIVPPFIETGATNQQVLYALASGTGGFVIANTNDLLGGLQRIAHEQNEYYLLGYAPPESEEGGCHTLKVKVDRGGTQVRARTGYCNVKSGDVLAGNPIEKTLAARAAAAQPGNVPASIELPFFYTSPNTALVSVAMEIPSPAIKFNKEKGRMHGAVDILGIAYKPDGSVGARFSDTVNLEFKNKKEVEEFQDKPFDYQNQFTAAAGKYTLKVVFTSGGESFGKIERPLDIEPYDGKALSIGSIALSNEVRRAADLGSAIDAALLEDRKTLVAQGVQVTPSATNHFMKTDNAVVYTEAYDPLLASDKPPKVQIQYVIFDRKTNEVKINTGLVDAGQFVQAGNPVIPMALKLPVDMLQPGGYRVGMEVRDSAGNKTKIRTIDFDVN
ncbi:MAG TPA: VWA domain-containing protein [Bryobacteraceae bacterium]|nr:VWA domain-containing protein [Bryobacteraceae bacterium]